MESAKDIALPRYWIPIHVQYQTTCEKFKGKNVFFSINYKLSFGIKQLLADEKDRTEVKEFYNPY